MPTFPHLWTLSQAKKRNRNSRNVRKAMKRLRKKSFRDRRNIRYPVVRKMFRVEKPWEINNKDNSRKAGCYDAKTLNRWARESLSLRFVLPKQEVDPHQDPSGQAGPSVRREPPTGNSGDVSRFALLVRDARVRKKFVRVCRGVLADLGIALVGPLPYRALEIMWMHFGEEHFSAHGRLCWCRLCRTDGIAQRSFLQSIGEALYDYFVSWKYVALATFGLIAPAPLKMAKFVATKLWKWLKILLD